MNDPRWGDLWYAADMSADHFRAADQLFALERFERTTQEGYRNLMAFLHAMQSGHTAFEDASLRLLGILDEARPTGPHWHRQLIDRAARPLPGHRPAIFPAEVAAAARATLGFRHLAMHAYSFDFLPSLARHAVESGSYLAEHFKPALASFAQLIDPD